MWTYNDTNELYHHGVKGMKWGVRKDKKGNADSANLAKALGRHTEAYSKFYTNTTHYYNPTTGNQTHVGDPKYAKNSLSTKRSYESLKQQLQKKYDSVEVKSNPSFEKGKAFVSVTLKKGKDTYITEMDADFTPVTEEYLRSIHKILEYS